MLIRKLLRRTSYVAGCALLVGACHRSSTVPPEGRSSTTTGASMEAPAAAADGTASGPSATTRTTPAVSPKTGPKQASTPAEIQARKTQLTAEQYRVTQHAGTEPAYRNAYYDQHAPGIYVDVVSGEPLFSSKEKYDSHTGWPSFYAPLEPGNIRTREDHELGMARTEVRSKHADSHLGHVFDDGPEPTGLRYCMNSASLRFVPAERLTVEGYGEYARLFPDVEQVAK